MDHLDAMKVLVVVIDEGSLAAAARKLARSPAAVGRAIAYLEKRVATELLHRTTRSIKLSEEGERYVAICRRVLAELEELELFGCGERSSPRGRLTLTSPVYTGETVLRPVVDGFLKAYPTVSARLVLFDRPINLIDEGVDVALRIGNLADSAMTAVRVGEARQVLVAAPSYLGQCPKLNEPADLAKHHIIGLDNFPNSWTFPPPPGSSVPRTVQFTPRLVHNSRRPVLASAIAGLGIARSFSYQAAEHIRRGELEIVLGEHELAPLPVHMISPPGRLSVPKVRTFVDYAAPLLRKHFACTGSDFVCEANIQTQGDAVCNAERPFSSVSTSPISGGEAAALREAA